MRPHVCTYVLDPKGRGARLGCFQEKISSIAGSMGGRRCREDDEYDRYTVDI